MSARFERSGQTLRLVLSEPERDLLRTLPDELGQLYEAARDVEPGTDPVRDRLFPAAYLDPTEEHAEDEWQELVHPELVRERLEALSRVVDSLEGATTARRGAFVVDLTDDDVPALLGVLNDARLALGIRLELNDETDLSEIDPSDPNAAAYAVYGWLTYLEGELIEVLLGELPDSDDD